MKEYTFSSEWRDFLCPLLALGHNVACDMSSLSETTVYEPHFQLQHRRVEKETMLQLPKRDLKGITWVGNACFKSATQSRNQVMNFKFRQWISIGSSEAGSWEKELQHRLHSKRERESTHFQTQKVQSKKQNSNGVEIAWGLIDLLDVPLT